MAIRIIEGVPGSGKTYYAVHHLLTKYFDYDKKLCEWRKKREFVNLVLVTNIDGFPFSVSLDSLVEKAGSLENFFSYEYQEKLTSGVPYVYLIDEAQGLFPFTYRDTRVFLFFQKHRHLGIDVYLITQDADHMAKGMRSLAEFHIVAVRRSLSLTGELRYRFCDPNTKECWNTQVLKKDGKIFSFYRSFSALETEKPPNVPRRFIIISGCALLIVLVGGYFGIVKKLTSRGKLSAAAEASEGPSKKKGDTSGKGQGLKIIPGANTEQNFNASSSNNKQVEIFISVVGVHSFGADTGFLVSVAGHSIALDGDSITRICKCHSEFVKLNDVYSASLTDLPANIRAAAMQGTAPAIQSAVPVPPSGRVSM